MKNLPFKLVYMHKRCIFAKIHYEKLFLDYFIFINKL